MDRKELKQILIERGVSARLVEMPAVMEPIYRELFDKTSSEVRETRRIFVDEEGGFSFDTRQIKLSPGSGATISYDDVLIEANIYGIEIEYSDGSYQDTYSSISRNDGKIDTFIGNHNNESGHGHVSLDNGSWSIRGARGADIVAEEYHNEKADEEIDAVDLDKDEILQDFDERADEIIAFYPQTREWYARTRRSLVEHIEIQNNPKLKEERRVERLERKVVRLEKENKTLIESGEKIAEKLEKALDFIGVIKRHPAGQIFFSKKLKEFYKDSKSLASARER